MDSSRVSASVSLLDTVVVGGAAVGSAGASSLPPLAKMAITPPTNTTAASTAPPMINGRLLLSGPLSAHDAKSTVDAEAPLPHDFSPIGCGVEAPANWGVGAAGADQYGSGLAGCSTNGG
ncbi:Uncharacterised protein [Mycobacteroides abscessus subsp. abscessus]|nr:Uncharacterised protein [Mycobacteroides abscessus subsp. abscessus]